MAEFTLSQPTHEPASVRLQASRKPMNRRRFLETLAVIAGTSSSAGAVLSACNTNSGVTGANNKTTLTVMYNVNEFSQQYINEFQKKHPDIKIRFVNDDPTRLSAMLAAGQPPDFIRTQGAPVLPNLAARKLVADLTPYFSASSVLKTDNMLPVNDVYRWDGQSQGQGSRYGMAKDWSQDVMMWYNKKLFDQAGVPYPSETQPLTYDELLDLGKRLTIRKNGKIQVYGCDASWGFVPQGHIIQMIAQQGGSLFNTDYTKVDFTTPEARKAVKWYVDWAQAHVGVSPLDPDPSSLFQANRLAITMYGYWYNGMIASDTQGLKDHVGFLPAPVMGPNRISSCMAGTGAWIPAVSKNKDAAWKLMEYFMTDTPSHDRAKSGWGIPSLKSLLPEMSRTIPYQKQAYQVQQAELPYLKVLKFSPYISDDAFTAAFDPVVESMMRNQLSFDSGIQKLNDTINQRLQQGKAQIS